MVRHRPRFMPRTQSLNFNLNHSYKRVVKEFFSNFSLNANRTWSNSVVDMQIQNGNYLMTYIQHNTKSTNLTGRCWLSKGFYKQHFKTSCSISATYSNGEQYTAGNILRYQYRSLTFSPTLTYSPSWAFVTYNGDFALSRSTSTMHLSHHVQLETEPDAYLHYSKGRPFAVWHLLS